MKTKKLGLITLIVLSMLFLFALNASAAWYTCTVTAAGQSNNALLIKLTDNGGTFTDRFFIAEEAKKNQILATALTAVSNGMNVEVNLSSSAEWNTIIAIIIRP
jgi:hypothetical protein